jgi:hypothetical protein
MFHDRSALRASAASLVHPAFRPAFDAAEALCDVGVEQAVLSRKLCDNVRVLLHHAAADKNAGRPVSDFVVSTTRDLSETMEAVSRIWRRYCRETVRTVSAAPGPFRPR